MSDLFKKGKNRMEYTETAAGKGPAELSENDLEQIVGGVNIDPEQISQMDPNRGKVFTVIQKMESIQPTGGLSSFGDVETTGNKTFEVLNQLGKVSRSEKISGTQNLHS